MTRIFPELPERFHTVNDGLTANLHRGRRLLFVALLTTILGACAQLGPNVLNTGRPLYNVAVQQTESQQLLLNIVRQRYSDPILFLDVTSITSSFTRQASAGLLGTVGSGSDTAGATLGATFSENPLITYAPNNGEKFVTQMLTPLDLRTVALVVQAGWSIERVLQIIGQSINQLRNSSSGTEEGKRQYLQYQAVVAALRDLQRNGELSVGAEPTEDSDDPGLSLLFAPSAVDSRPYRVICESIKVSCDGQPLRLRQAIGISHDGLTMSLATRSLFSALYFLAQGVEVPSTDAGAGVASPAPIVAGGPFDLARTGESLFRVQSSSIEPESAAVKIFYRNSWFYIADNDVDSKVTFALISMLVMLQSGDSAKVTPLITLPAG